MGSFYEGLFELLKAEISKGYIPNPIHVRKLPGKYRLFFRIASLLVCASASAQVPVDSITPPLARGESVLDTVPKGPQDSVEVDLSGIKVSDDALGDVVEYGAVDSMWFDAKSKQVHLYGSAFVKYTPLNVKAGYILLDYTKNEIAA